MAIDLTRMTGTPLGDTWRGWMPPARRIELRQGEHHHDNEDEEDRVEDEYWDPCTQRCLVLLDLFGRLLPTHRDPSANIHPRSADVGRTCLLELGQQRRQIFPRNLLSRRAPLSFRSLVARRPDDSELVAPRGFQSPELRGQVEVGAVLVLQEIDDLEIEVVRNPLVPITLKLSIRVTAGPELGSNPIQHGGSVRARPEERPSARNVSHQEDARRTWRFLVPPNHLFPIHVDSSAAAGPPQKAQPQAGRFIPQGSACSTRSGARPNCIM